jgi:hypothetical protein
VASKRVADDVRGLEARLVHSALDRVGERGVAHLPLDRRPTRVPGEGQGQDVVSALERGQNELPGAPGVGEAVEAYERRPGAFAVRGVKVGDRRRTLLAAAPGGAARSHCRSSVPPAVVGESPQSASENDRVGARRGSSVRRSALGSTR